MIWLSQASNLLGIILVLIVPEEFAGYVFFFLGMGFGPVYPTMLQQTPELFGTKYSASIMGLEMSAAYIGSAMMPALFGVIGRSFSMSLFPFYILVIFIIYVTVLELKVRRAAKNQASR